MSVILYSLRVVLDVGLFTFSITSSGTVPYVFFLLRYATEMTFIYS